MATKVYTVTCTVEKNSADTLVYNDMLNSLKKRLEEAAGPCERGGATIQLVSVVEV